MLLALVVVGGVATAASVEPVTIDGWQAGDAAYSCAQATTPMYGPYLHAYKIDDWEWNMDGTYESDSYNPNTFYISNDTLHDDRYRQETFDWDADNSVGAVIVKAGTGANVYYYDPQALGDIELEGYAGKEISHVVFCWNPDGTCAEEGTGWSAGLRYNQRGNWATYTPYDGEWKKVDLLAGRTMRAGYVIFKPFGEQVKIVIKLHDGWRFGYADAEKLYEESIHIQDYEKAPSGNPAPGRFKFKYEAPSGSKFITAVPKNNFYGVHVSLLHEVECP